MMRDGWAEMALLTILFGMLFSWAALTLRAEESRQYHTLPADCWDLQECDQ